MADDEAGTGGGFLTYDLGILGGGQLARMSVQAAQRMGLRCLSLDSDPNSPAAQIAPSIQGRLDDPSALAQVLASCTHVTLENEFIPASALIEAVRAAGVDEGVLIPGIGAMGVIQDKLLQRRAYAAAGVPTPRAVDLVELLRDPSLMPLPVVLKARFGGYDGKGTRYARTPEEFSERTADLGDGTGWLAEEFVPFERELAVMVFIGDQKGAFPTVETIQTHHVCDLVFPSATDGSEIGIAAVEAVGGRGLFGVELFQLADGSLSINEMAPRPHNTGHYTLDWGATSQFEQHVRLAMGFPVDPAPRGVPMAMANLLGVSDGGFDLASATSRGLSVAGAHVHWYGKLEIRKGRKMGHINAPTRELAEVSRRRFYNL